MRAIGYIAFPGFGILSFAAVSVFETANTIVEDSYYKVRFLSEEGGLVTSSIGIQVMTYPFDDTILDTMIIGGSGTMPFTPKLLEFLRYCSKTARRIGATCTGQFFLAEAGILQGRLVTAHWHYANEFRRSFPTVRLDETKLFIIDGPIWTSAGMTAGIDQTLAMVEEDLGLEVAQKVAKVLLLPYRRAGGLPQHTAMIELSPKSSRIQEALAYAHANLAKSLKIEELAEAARISPRQFTRLFKAETGRSPAKAIEMLRMEAARVLVQEGKFSIEDVARQTGFHDRERMRRAFMRHFGKPPQIVRRAARTSSHHV